MKKLTINTSYFRDAANHFEKHGCYTFAPMGTEEYDDYWDEQEDRCKNGYEVGGFWITGKHYFAMNFCPMERLKTEKEYNQDKATGKMIYSLPRFWEIDYEYWIIKHIMQFGATKEELKQYSIPFLKEEPYEAGKHLAILKTRRGGYSYKEAAEAVWNYTFVRNSKSFFFTSTEKYLTEDGIINKVGAMLDWLDMYTDFGKTRIIDKDTHKKAGYKEQGSQTVKGFKSEIMGTSLKDSADGARGKSGLKIAFEEAGSFKYLLDAWIVCRPQVEQGGVVKGYITAFGTGGNKKDDGLESLQKIFDNPTTYNCMAFRNIWEEELIDTECGLFIPTTAIREKLMDKNGIVDKEKAKKVVEDERKKWKTADDPTLYVKSIAENPLTPAEALTRISKTFFPVRQLKEQLRYIQTNSLQRMWVNGELIKTKKGLKFQVNEDLSPLESYPIKPKENARSRLQSLAGCISILQQPIKDASGKVPKNLYIMAVDPYAQDESEYSDSVGACYVFKRESSETYRDELSDGVVARYVGRPKTTDIFWRNVFNLAQYYNTKVQSEILGGGSIGITYARTHKPSLLSLCESQIDVLNPRVSKNNNGETKFMKVSSDMKSDGLKYLDQWLRAERGIKGNGDIVYNYNKIYDVGLLRELIQYNDEKNFDRVSAMIVMMHLYQQKKNKKVRAIDRQKLRDGKTSLSFWGSENFYQAPSIKP